MAFEIAALNIAADAVAAAVDYIGLVDENGTEISGGSPAYARKAATWNAATNGSAALASDLIFDIAANKKVKGWRGFSAVSGGTGYGGEALTEKTDTSQWQYRLKAGDTKITFENKPPEE